MENLKQSFPEAARSRRPETPAQFAVWMDEETQKWGSVFKDKEQLEYFALLPLSEDQKKWLIKKLLADSHQQRTQALNVRKIKRDEGKGDIPDGPESVKSVKQ